MSPNIPSSESTPAVSDAEPVAATDLVVASQHWELVAAELDGLVAEVESSEALKLTKVTIPDVARAVGLFVDELRGPVVLPGQNLILLPETPLDRVLAGLRVRFARRYSGWVPTLGKNRDLVDGVGSPIFIALDAPGGEPSPVSGSSYGTVAPPTAGTGIRIGVLDTAVYLPDDADPAERGLAGLDDANRLRPADGAVLPFWKGHGTFVTGLIHQHAPAAQIVLQAVLTGNEATAKAWDVAKALVALADLDIDVINLSLATVTTDNQPPLVLQTAVEAVSRRSVLVGAAGNYAITDGPHEYTPPAWPAALDGVLAVGSTSPDGTRSAFSPNEPWVGRTERGEDLVSTYLNGKVTGARDQFLDEFSGYASWSGTSFAAAVVSGRLAALATERGCSVREALAFL